jgi:hypothetical protein
MKIFFERFVLAILASFVVLLVAINPMGFGWLLRIIGIVVIIVLAGMAAHFAGWDEWRWERLRGVWWFWSAIGISTGVALVVWLTPFLAPDQPNTVLPPAAALPKIEFVKNQAVWRENAGDNGIKPVITYYARFSTTGTHLRVFVEYQSISTDKISPNRVQIADVHDYVKNDELIAPVMSRKDGEGGKYILAWGGRFLRKSHFRHWRTKPSKDYFSERRWERTTLLFYSDERYHKQQCPSS